MASSKSFASNGSIVKVRVFRKSVRFGISLAMSCTLFLSISSASFSTATGKSISNPFSSTIDSISALLFPFCPITFTISPPGFSFAPSQPVIRTCILSPAFRFSVFFDDRVIVKYAFLSSGIAVSLPL